MSAKSIKTEEKSAIAYNNAVNYVTAERAELTRVGTDLLTLLSKYTTNKNSLTDQETLTVRTKILELSQHLGNIAGYCDSNGRDLINLYNLNFSQSMIQPMFYQILLAYLPSIIGIQVDFTKAPPFKVISGNAEVLGQKLKGFLKR